MISYIKIGKQINNENDLKNYRRLIAFVLRAILNFRCVNRIITFFNSTNLRKKIVARYPYIIAQVVRPNFFRKSTSLEKSNIIENHFMFLEKHFTENAIENIYCGDGVELWDDTYNNEKIAIKCYFHFFDKKEGLMRLELAIADRRIYHVAFWISPGFDGQESLYIGALQGAFDGADSIRDLTKHFFGYRPKNLVTHVLRTFARQLSIKRIYAVSNYGFYDSTLPVRKRKLKSSLDEFWQETGGSITGDVRFYELQIDEPRKSMEEIVSHKRNLYRKRFEVLDSIDEALAEKLKLYLVTPKTPNSPEIH